MNESDGKKNQIKNNVEHILENYPESRDDDMFLFWKYWEVYDNIAIGQKTGYIIWDLDFLLKATNPTAIHRLRAKIQNEDKRFLPLKWITAQKRGWSRNDWEQYLGYELPEEERQQKLLNI